MKRYAVREDGVNGRGLGGERSERERMVRLEREVSKVAVRDERVSVVVRLGWGEEATQVPEEVLLHMKSPERRQISCLCTDTCSRLRLPDLPACSDPWRVIAKHNSAAMKVSLDPNTAQSSLLKSFGPDRPWNSAWMVVTFGILTNG